MTETEVLEKGDRIYLRRPVEADRAAFHALVEASREFLREWEPVPPASDPSIDGRFDRLIHLNAGGGDLKTFVCRSKDDAVVGCANINNIVRGVFQSASFGYWMGAPYVRKGYMTEALRLLMRHAFGVLGLHRVEANVMPKNAASIALVKRAGFRREGYSPKYLQIAGEWADHERWALLAEEWQGTSP